MEKAQGFENLAWHLKIGLFSIFGAWLLKDLDRMLEVYLDYFQKDWSAIFTLYCNQRQG